MVCAEASQRDLYSVPILKVKSRQFGFLLVFWHINGAMEILSLCKSLRQSQESQSVNIAMASCDFLKYLQNDEISDTLLYSNVQQLLKETKKMVRT